MSAPVVTAKSDLGDPDTPNKNVTRRKCQAGMVRRPPSVEVRDDASLPLFCSCKEHCPKLLASAATALLNVEGQEETYQWIREYKTMHFVAVPSQAWMDMWIMDWRARGGFALPPATWPEERLALGETIVKAHTPPAPPSTTSTSKPGPGPVNNASEPTGARAPPARAAAAKDHTQVRPPTPSPPGRVPTPPVEVKPRPPLVPVAVNPHKPGRKNRVVLFKLGP